MFISLGKIDRSINVHEVIDMSRNGKAANKNKRTQINDNSPHATYKVARLDDLDSLDLTIVIELSKNAYISSSEIAKKSKAPLSTVQRRRQRLEGRLLQLKYTLDLANMGWRTANLSLSVSGGRSSEIADSILQQFKRNIMNVDVVIGNPHVNVEAKVFFRTTQELYELLEAIKALPNVGDVSYSELVLKSGSNESEMIGLFFAKHQDK